MNAASLWPTEQPWDKCDETSFVYQPPPTIRQKPSLRISTKPIRPVGDVVYEIIQTNDKLKIPEKYLQKRNLNINYNKPMKNDSHLWAVVNNNSLSTISETSSPPMSPLKSPLSPEIYTSIFFEYTAETEKPDEKFASIDLILWERLSYQHVYPNVSILRRVRTQSESSSKSGSIKGIFKRLSKRRTSTDSEAISEVAVLSMPGLTSSMKRINDLGKEVKSIPLSSSISLLSQTRGLLFPDAAWYYDYLDGVSVGTAVMHVLSMCADL